MFNHSSIVCREASNLRRSNHSGEGAKLTHSFNLPVILYLHLIHHWGIQPFRWSVQHHTQHKRGRRASDLTMFIHFTFLACQNNKSRTSTLVNNVYAGLNPKVRHCYRIISTNQQRKDLQTLDFRVVVGWREESAVFSSELILCLHSLRQRQLMTCLGRSVLLSINHSY